jgi:hypothetical protein
VLSPDVAGEIRLASIKVKVKENKPPHDQEAVSKATGEAKKKSYEGPTPVNISRQEAEAMPQGNQIPRESEVEERGS